MANTKKPTRGRRVVRQEVSGRTVTERKQAEEQKEAKREERLTARLVGPGLPDLVRRRLAAYRVRVRAARRELFHPPEFQSTNGDEERFATRIGNFAKTLPHNERGEVDPEAYKALLQALESRSLEALDKLPGGPRKLLNPLGGMTFLLEGPDTHAVAVNPPPSIASAEWAAQMAELYWMALLRDVPFSEYESHPVAQEARRDLARFSGYTGPRDSATGEIRAQDLFRVDYPGVRDGPMVSQFLLQGFSYDGVELTQKISTAAPGKDFLTSFDEWLKVQNGGFDPKGDPRDEVARFVRNARDLGRTAGQDAIYSQYFKAVLILLGLFGFAGDEVLDTANPYRGSERQLGFATFGFAHLLELVGTAHKSERHAWFQKWNVHRFLRPEEGGGRVHVAKTGQADYPLHEDLLRHSSVLERIFEYNLERNRERKREGEDVEEKGTYLLPLLFRNGGPTHPSFTAGHAISAGACVTMLKAWYNEDVTFPEPMKPTPDGLELEPYMAGRDGPELTVGGELNKLAHNLSWGRDMSGVHWRADDFEGVRQGEEVAIRILREQKDTYPERFSGFHLTRFDGSKIII